MPKMWWKKVLGLLKSSPPPVVRIAILDGDRTWLTKISKIFSAVPSVHVSLYHYPTNILSFKQDVENFDVALISQNLGSEDGLGLARGLFSAGSSTKILVVTGECPSKFSEFKYYLDKRSVETNPNGVLNVSGTPTEQAVELSMLFHIRNGV